MEKRKIILVDEGTSNIDQGLEEKVRDVLENLHGTTVIAIAHRLIEPSPTIDLSQEVSSKNLTEQKKRVPKKVPGWFRNGRVIEIREGTVFDEGFMD